jgi:hypothetical protein
MYNHYPCFKWPVTSGEEKEEEEKRREKPDLNNTSTKRIRLTKKFQSHL